MISTLSLMRWLMSLSPLEAAIALLVVFILAVIGSAMVWAALHELFSRRRW